MAAVGRRRACAARRAPTCRPRPGSEAPSVAEIAAAYPARPRPPASAARSTLTCEIGRDGHPRDCAALKEKPSGYGFGAAARKLAEKMGVDDAGHRTARNVLHPGDLRPRVLNGDAVVTKPVWAELPSAAGLPGDLPEDRRTA